MIYPYSNLVVLFVVSAVLTLFFLCVVASSIYRGIRRKRIGQNDRIVIFSAISAVVLVLSDMVCKQRISGSLTYEISVSLFPMVAALKTDSRGTWPSACGFAVLVIAVSVMILRIAVPADTVWLSFVLYSIPVLAVLSMLAMLYTDFVSMISDRSSDFREMTLRDRMKNDAGSLHVACLFAIMFLQMAADGIPALLGEILTVICMLCALLLFLICYLRITTGKVFVLDCRKEGKLQSIPEECAVRHRITSGMEQTFRAIYDRLVIYFEKEKPYLDAGLTIVDVARETYCNKLYLSRAINIYTGKNYCQYVNYHRIRHAVKLFEENDTLKVHQWAEQCGFRTVASFNMAFKLYMNDSPGEWCRKRRGDDISGIRTKKVRLEHD